MVEYDVEALRREKLVVKLAVATELREALGPHLVLRYGAGSDELPEGGRGEGW